MKTYIFVRKEGFYPIKLKDDEEAKMNAEINEGTIQVIDPLTEDVIWDININSN
jgi:hypothetical protein